MPIRENDTDRSHDKAHEDNVKLLIALGRALGHKVGAHAKTPTHASAVGVKNLGQ